MLLKNNRENSSQNLSLNTLYIVWRRIALYFFFFCMPTAALGSLFSLFSRPPRLFSYIRLFISLSYLPRTAYSSLSSLFPPIYFAFGSIFSSKCTALESYTLSRIIGSRTHLLSLFNPHYTVNLLNILSFLEAGNANQCALHSVLWNCEKRYKYKQFAWQMYIFLKNRIYTLLNVRSNFLRNKK